MRARYWPLSFMTQAQDNYTAADAEYSMSHLMLSFAGPNGGVSTQAETFMAA
jgi:hypothetical protein